MPTFKQNIATIKRARRDVEKAQSNLYKSRLAVQHKAGDNLSDETIASELRGPEQDFKAALDKLNQGVDLLHATTDYRDVAQNLDANFPIVMLPVRMETRFVDNATGQQLWVRVYPDDFHVHSFEELLTEDEIKAGSDYWRALLLINRSSGDNKEDKKKEVWKVFAKRLGAQRAHWIAQQTMPENWKPNLKIPVDKLIFPSQFNTKTHEWTRAPQTQLLPDRFVLQIFNDNQQVHHVVGRPIPDTVFLGPDPFLAEKAFEQTEEKITLDESFAWISDFDEAVKKGLGFKVDVLPQMLNHGGIDRMVVSGVLASVDPMQTKVMLEEHLHAHRYSTKGFSFLPLGTPTNNTDDSASGYQHNVSDLPQGYFDATPESALAEQTDSDGLAFCRALGIDANILTGTKGADGTQVADAQAMNDALYPATIGFFVEVLLLPGMLSSTLDKLRDFFHSHVSSSGSVPSIRVGDQPYGVLVTSDLNRWTEPEDDQFATGLLSILLSLQSTWKRIAANDVAHVGKSGDADQILLDIMGLSPGSTSFRQRMGHLNDVPLSATNVSDTTRAFETKQNEVMDFLRQVGYTGDTFPLASALSYYRRNDNIPLHHLVDRRRASATRYLSTTGVPPLNFIDGLAVEKSVDALEKHTLTSGRPPRSVLYFLLRHSLLLSLQKAALNTYKDKGLDLSRLANEKSLLNFDREAFDLTTWELLKGKPNKVDRDQFDIDVSMGEHLLGMRSNNSAVADLTRVRRALKRLARLPTLTLQRHLTAHFDLASYRLDAWHTGFFTKRLSRNRDAAADGLYIGAYGWLENIRPNRKDLVQVPPELRPANGEKVQELRGNAGFVHTPSLNHATAAGVLLAGYRHNATPRKPSMFSVNLSSDRVRRAKHLLTGIQNGQSLEALLGYQFERALHDRTSADPTINLQQHILSLREKFPIEHAGIPQAGSEAQETVPAYSVVNGMKLVHADGRAFTSLGIAADHLLIVRAEIDRLRDSLDAMGDLLTSETAFQMVQGKGDRLAGLLNSFKDATLPPDFEIDQTPRTTHLSVSNKVCLSMGDVPVLDAEQGWARRMTPRAGAEPGINRWLGHLLGRADRIVCSVATVDGDDRVNRRKFSLADLNIHPIDLMYTVGIDIHTGARDLEPALFDLYTAKVAVADDATVIVEFDTDMVNKNERTLAQVLPLLRYLRLMMTTAKAASARDFRPRSQTVEEQPAQSFGWDVDAFDERIAALIEQLDVPLTAMERSAPNGARPKSDDNPASLGRAFEIYGREGRGQEYFTKLALTTRTLKIIIDTLAVLPLFGMRAVLTDNIDTDTPEGRTHLLVRTESAWRDARARIVLAQNKRTEASDVTMKPDLRIRRLTEAGKAVLGDDFLFLPDFRFSNASDVRQSLAERSRGLLDYYSTEYETTSSLAIETWLQSLSPVRPSLQRLEQVRMISEFHDGDPLSFEAIQLPYRENDSWLAVEFPATDPTTGEPFQIRDDTLSICISGLEEAKVGGRQRMLMLDHWTESVPMNKEVTGVAFNYDQPNASAPNSLLVAVEPTGSDTWSWDALTGTLTDTLERARTRAVEPAQLLEETSLDALLPMLTASFDMQESNLSLDFLATNDDLVERLKDEFQLYRDFD